MSLKERINLVKQQFGISEADTLNIEKALGKKLVDYESIEALVAALMGYYNPLIEGISETFKNFCPFPINSLYLSLGSENPSTLWLGTTWQKQEGRFLLGSSGSYSLGATGGASSIALSTANLPSHTHSASQSAHTHSQPTHTHTTKITTYGSSSASNLAPGGAWWSDVNRQSSASGGDTTGSATPAISIGATGSGTAFSILPPYLVVNIWKRLS